jgi:lipid II:glycine glycyltransferase (peptidoglycan interpeptide bridge formation enzyme)
VSADGRRFGLLALTRKAARLFTIAYVPFGPVFDPRTGRGEYLRRIASALRPHLPRGTVFLRFDLPWEKSGEAPGEGDGARKSRDDIQPPSTVIVDLSPPLEGILSGMKSKTRYNIRLAAKKGVVVSEGGGGDMEAWYGIYRETSRRDRIAIHARSYYEDLFLQAREYRGAAPRVMLLLARAEEELLAGNIVILWKKSAVYLTGASSGEKRNLMPTYALQWEAMKKARESGCTAYDLFGVPPLPDPDHPMYGLFQFKTGFSEKVTERWGTWDVPFLPVRFRAYAAAEAARLFFFRVLKKRALKKNRQRQT